MRPGHHCVVEGIATHLALYLRAVEQLTALLNRENTLLLYAAGEIEVLRNHAAQEAKHALYARVETLARILTQTLKHGAPEDAATIRGALGPLTMFRRSLRLNSVLLEIGMQRRSRRLARIMEAVASQEATPCR